MPESVRVTAWTCAAAALFGRDGLGACSCKSCATLLVCSVGANSSGFGTASMSPYSMPSWPIDGKCWTEGRLGIAPPAGASLDFVFNRGAKGSFRGERGKFPGETDRSSRLGRGLGGTSGNLLAPRAAAASWALAGRGGMVGAAADMMGKPMLDVEICEIQSQYKYRSGGESSWSTDRQWDVLPRRRTELG